MKKNPKRGLYLSKDSEGTEVYIQFFSEETDSRVCSYNVSTRGRNTANYQVFKSIEDLKKITGIAEMKPVSKDAKFKFN